MATLRLLPLTTRLMLAVMLLGTLAPTVSRALAARDSAVGTDICSTTQPQSVPSADEADASLTALARAAAPDSPHSALLLDHCPFCLHVAERFGPPSALPVHFFDAESGLARPDMRAPFFSSPLILTTWARGPPVQA